MDNYYFCKVGKDKFTCESLEAAIECAQPTAKHAVSEIERIFCAEGQYHCDEKKIYIDYIDTDSSITNAIEQFKCQWESRKPLVERAKTELSNATTIILQERADGGPWIETRGAAALPVLNHWLFVWDKIDTVVPERFASIHGDEALLIAFQELNNWKRNFNTWHTAFRATFLKHFGEVVASENMRTVFRLAGESNLDLEKADRMPSVSSIPIRRLTFNYKVHRSSKRSNVGEARNFLDSKNGKNTKLTPEMHAKLSRELYGLPADKPIYRVLRKGVVRPYFRALLHGGHPAVTGMAHQPVIALQSNATSMQFNLPESNHPPRKFGDNIAAKDENDPGIFGAILPGWYWYKVDPVDSKPKEDKPQKSLLIRGIRKTKDGYIQVRSVGGKRTSFQIKKHGLEGAFKKAAELYCAERPEYDLQTVLDTLANY